MLRNMNEEELLHYTGSLLDVNELERELANRLQKLLADYEEVVDEPTLTLIANLQKQINVLNEKLDGVIATQNRVGCTISGLQKIGN